MKNVPFVTIAVAVSLAAGAAMAQRAPLAITPDQVKWGPAPDLPADWQAAVLNGDPAKKGPYVERIKLPPNASVPMHKHPDVEYITVLSGSFGIGHDPSGDKAKGQMLSTGSFYRLPASTPHYAWAGPEGAVLQIHGVGPSGIKFIKPAAEKH